MARTPGPVSLRLASIWLWTGSAPATIGLGLAWLAARFQNEHSSPLEVPALRALAAVNMLPVAGAAGLRRGCEWGWLLLGIGAGCGLVVGCAATLLCVDGTVIGGLRPLVCLAFLAPTVSCFVILRKLSLDRAGAGGRARRRSWPPS